MAASAERSSLAGRAGRDEGLRAGAAAVLFADALAVVDLTEDLSAIRLASREAVVPLPAFVATGFLSTVFLAALLVVLRFVGVFAADFFALDFAVVFLDADLATRLGVEVFFAGLMGGGP